MIIEINLLPQEFRVIKKKQQTEKLPVNLILLGVNALFLVIFLVVSAINIARVITLNALDTQLKGLAPEQHKIINLQQDMERLKITNAMFTPYVSSKFLWSRTLNILSNEINRGVWLRELSYKKIPADSLQNPQMAGIMVRTLVIDGTVISTEHDEMSLINDFVSNLKKNAEFFGYFDKIELESVLRRRIADVEVMDFTLNCSFRLDINI
ncbi:MAG: hypothetical protein HY810_09615 [Candidatus Omnitrophica bacterium]|nr:hypothetical protein [Candidatus Omnitrophota bacterium]